MSLFLCQGYYLRAITVSYELALRIQDFPFKLSANLSIYYLYPYILSLMLVFFIEYDKKKVLTMHLLKLEHGVQSNDILEGSCVSMVDNENGVHCIAFMT